MIKLNVGDEIEFGGVCYQIQPGPSLVLRRAVYVPQLPKVGDRLYFDEMPDGLWEREERVYGIIGEVNPLSEIVEVSVEVDGNAYNLMFDIDGSPWDNTDLGFKREQFGYVPDHA